MLPAHPITVEVPGAPVQPGDPVLVVQATDASIDDVSAFIGLQGVVVYLEYDCGCGQTFPTDPMVGVAFSGGASYEFWREELLRLEERPS